MDQSTLIVGAMLAGFILYLAAANRLGTYVAILTGRVQTQGSTAAPAAGGAGGILGGLLGGGALGGATGSY